MKWQRPRDDDPEIGMTPLIDVVFLLLIFFMISTTFKDESEITIDLPRASTQNHAEQRPPISVTIDAEGHYYVDHRRLVNDAEGTLRKALERLLAGDHAAADGLTIKADGRTTHESVVRVMDVARQLGIVHIALATRPAAP